MRQEKDLVRSDEIDEILWDVDHAFDEFPPKKPWERPTETKPAPDRER